MALSGTINGRVTLNSQYMSFYITWSAKQNVEGNYSDVTVTSYWKTNNTLWGFDTEGSRSASITINGKTTSISKRFDSTNGTDTGWKQPNPWALQTVTERVYHNSDGSKSIAISARANGYAASYGPSNSSASSGDCTASGTISLDTIPRASKVAATNADIGSTSTITVSRYSTSFKHTVSFSCDGISDTVIESDSEASVIPWTVPESIYATIPAAKYATVTITCRTYSKTTGALIGTDTATMRATASEAECKPAVYGTVTDANAITVILTGNAKTLIRYKSTARCEITATAKNSAYIEEDARYVNGVSIPTGTVEIQNSEAVSFAFSATDSRGYSASALVQPTVIPYIPLTINPTFKRVSPTSNIITVEFYGNFFSGSFGAAENELTVKYQYREYGTETWSAYVTVPASSIDIPGDGTYNSNGAVTIGSDFDYRKSYEIRIVAQDGNGTTVLSEVSSVAQVTRGEPVFDWSNTDFRVRETLRTANMEPDGDASIGTEGNPYAAGYFSQLFKNGKEAITQDDIKLTASRAVVTGSDGKLAASAVTATELGYLDGATSNIQAQLNARTLRVHRVLSGSMSQNSVLTGSVPFTPRFFCLVYYDGGWYCNFFPWGSGYNGTEFRHLIYDNYHRYKLTFSNGTATLTKTGSGTVSTYLEAYS